MNEPFNETQSAGLGETLKKTRERMGMSTSKAAASTRIKIQHIEAMEADDFSDIAAPAYAKGFIRLYAQHLGLDPEPLIQLYLDQHAPVERSPLMEETAAKKRARRPWQRPAKQAPAEKDVSSSTLRPPKAKREGPSLLAQSFTWVRANAAHLARVARWAGMALLTLVLLVAILRFGSRWLEESKQPVKELPTDGLLREPPEPYLEINLPVDPARETP